MSEYGSKIACLKINRRKIVGLNLLFEHHIMLPVMMPFSQTKVCHMKIHFCTKIAIEAGSKFCSESIKTKKKLSEANIEI